MDDPLVGANIQHLIGYAQTICLSVNNSAPQLRAIFAIQGDDLLLTPSKECVTSKHQ